MVLQQLERKLLEANSTGLEKEQVYASKTRADRDRYANNQAFVSKLRRCLELP